ncbi:sugar transporter domain-containing protein [Sarocladium implicatum]|nr:sugar transporter domain-containing protein [Sarocladium implicatum]
MAHHLRNLSIPHRLSAQARVRRANDRAIIENPLTHYTDEELEEDVKQFADDFLPSVNYDSLLRAAWVARDIRIYDEVARSEDSYSFRHLPVQLTPDEKRALRREKDVPFSEKGMRVVIVTVSLAALLQGFVQSSFNGATLYKAQWGLEDNTTEASAGSDEWQLGATNASPWFFAAILGCPLALPINYYYGRRGGLAVAAFLIFVSSLAAVWADTWPKLFGIRIINGIGMGIKAVSTPILASETAVGFWRGSSVLAWQLWVAFGIMMGFAFNLIFAQADTDSMTYHLINGAPFLPSLVLLGVVVFLCPESPRYHLMKGPNYDPERAYAILRTLRNTELQALRDMYTVHKSIEQEYMGMISGDGRSKLSPGFWWTMRDFVRQFKQLFQQRRLYNAVMSTSTVALSQQLCGVNVIAFYSGTLFNSSGADKTVAMGYSLAFGAMNFIFALPAIKSIDTLGRRKWLLMTLPCMALCMLGGSLSFLIDGGDNSSNTRSGVIAFFLFMFAIFYSPGLGPIPFTLASESFPLTHREAGTAWAVSINLGAAGFLAMFYPRIAKKMTDAGSLGFFAFLNVVAFVLVFLLVEETKRRSLEDLDLVFAVSKRRFMSFNVQQYGPWWIKRHFMGRREAQPELYHDMIWGPMITKEHDVPSIGEDEDVPPPPPPPPKSPHFRSHTPAQMEMQAPVHPLNSPSQPIELPTNPLGSNPPRSARSIPPEDFRIPRYR